MLFFKFLSSLVIAVLAGLTHASLSPSVKLDEGIFVGKTIANLTAFYGIRYATAPRFDLPRTVKPYYGKHDATRYGPSCPQHGTGLNTSFTPGSSLPDGEDCLFVNVVTPADFSLKPRKLPAIVWIHGGAFEVAGSSLREGQHLVERSKMFDEEVVFVTMNYRLAGFGFLASQEVKDAGVANLGLHDQRQALRWVQRYIKHFGGDPKRITLAGDSAGSISATLQMLTNQGNLESLFHTVVALSGTVMPVDDVTRGQANYDGIVVATGCSTTPDTLKCLREVPYSAIKMVLDATPKWTDYKSLMLTYMPRVDGKFIEDHPQKLINEGLIANIPYLSGLTDDEGTLFAQSTLNITTNADFQEYVQTLWFPFAPAREVDYLMSLYSEDPAAGSPFDTGAANTITPQYKHMAAFQGDAVFQAPRRAFLTARSGKQPIWAYLNKRAKSTPFLGSFHSTDFNFVLDAAGSDLQDYVINFILTHNPNSPTTTFKWPKYQEGKPTLLTLKENATLVLETDDARKEQMAFLTNITLRYPF